MVSSIGWLPSSTGFPYPLPFDKTWSFGHIKNVRLLWQSLQSLERQHHFGQRGKYGQTLRPAVGVWGWMLGVQRFSGRGEVLRITQEAVESISAMLWNTHWFPLPSPFLSWIGIAPIRLHPYFTNWPCPDQEGLLGHGINSSPLVFLLANLRWLWPTAGATYTFIISCNKPNEKVWVPAEDGGWQQGAPG